MVSSTVSALHVLIHKILKLQDSASMMVGQTRLLGVQNEYARKVDYQGYVCLPKLYTLGVSMTPPSSWPCSERQNNLLKVMELARD